MRDQESSGLLDQAPEADYAEQSVPAYPDDEVAAPDDPAFSDAGDSFERDLIAVVDRDAYSANSADVVDQYRTAPFDDDREPSGE